MPANGRLDGKVAIVTGAARGIGRSSAELFAAEGASVVAVDREDPLQFGALGDGIVPLVVDLADPASAERMVGFAVQRFGSIDVLFNNAATAARGVLHDETLEDWNRVLDVNVTAPFLASRCAIPFMLDQGGGVILATASISAFVVGPGSSSSSYKVSKAGLVMLMRTIAAEYGNRGIRANAIAPGAINTAPRHDGRAVRAIPMGRVGTADEVARLALFLASDDASYVTGALMTVDGGMTIDQRAVDVLPERPC